MLQLRGADDYRPIVQRDSIQIVQVAARRDSYVSSWKSIRVWTSARVLLAL